MARKRTEIKEERQSIYRKYIVQEVIKVMGLPSELPNKVRAGLAIWKEKTRPEIGKPGKGSKEAKYRKE